MLKLHSQLLKSRSFLEMWVVGFIRMHKKDENFLSNHKKWFEGKFRYGKHHFLIKNSSKSEAKTQKSDSSLMYKFLFYVFPNLMVEMICSIERCMLQPSYCNGFG